MLSLSGGQDRDKGERYREEEGRRREEYREDTERRKEEEEGTDGRVHRDMLEDTTEGGQRSEVRIGTMQGHSLLLGSAEGN